MSEKNLLLNKYDPIVWNFQGLPALGNSAARVNKRLKTIPSGMMGTDTTTIKRCQFWCNTAKPKYHNMS